MRAKVTGGIRSTKHDLWSNEIENLLPLFPCCFFWKKISSEFVPSRVGHWTGRERKNSSTEGEGGNTMDTFSIPHSTASAGSLVQLHVQGNNDGHLKCFLFDGFPLICPQGKAGA